MVRWIREWAMLSALLILAMGMIFVFWAIWPLLPGRLPLYLLSSLNPEGIFAMLLLTIVLVGFGKLMRSK